MNPQLGAFSDDAVAASVAVFLFALVAFAAEWAFGSAGGVSRRAAREQPGGQRSARETSGGARADGLVGRDRGTAGGSTVRSAAVAPSGGTAVLERTATTVAPSGTPSSGTPSSTAPGHGLPVAAGGPGTSDGGRRSATAGSIGSMLLQLAVLVLGVGVVTRGIAAQRVPWGNLYEFAITGSFVVTAVHVLLRRRLGLQFLDVWLAGFAATCSGSALLLFHEDVGPLRPQLRSTWLVIHVSAAVVATGIFTVGAVLCALYLFKSRREAAGRLAGGYAGRIPSAARLDRMAYRVHAFGFPIYTLALVFGAVWAKVAYGRYWEWDPKETWMLISWVVYAAYLHARATAGWKGRVAAVIALVAFGTVLFNLLGVNFLIAGKHSYAS